MTGGYQWDEDGQVATVTPFQSLFTSVGGILGELQTVLGWRAQQEAALDARQAAHAAPVRRRQAQVAARQGRGPRPRGGSGPAVQPPAPPRRKPGAWAPGAPLASMPRPGAATTSG